jgi:hypothetical protein
MLEWIVARLREPSTYAGLAGLIGTMTFLPHATDVATAMPAVGTFVMSMLAMTMSEKH